MRAIRAAWLVLSLASWAAGENPSGLKDLYQRQQWFRLCEAVLAAKDPHGAR